VPWAENDERTWQAHSQGPPRTLEHRVTSDRYGHLFPKARQALADGLDETFRRAAATPPATETRPTGVVPFPDASQGPGKGP